MRDEEKIMSTYAVIETGLGGLYDATPMLQDGGVRVGNPEPEAVIFWIPPATFRLVIVFINYPGHSVNTSVTAFWRQASNPGFYKIAYCYI